MKHEYKVQAVGGPLAITLVWTDHPALAFGGFKACCASGILPSTHSSRGAAPTAGCMLCFCAASQALIIDLDLEVRPAGLNGTVLRGNGGSVRGADQPDR